MAAKSLGDALVAAGAIDSLQLQAAIGHHKQWGVPIDDALLEKRLCSKEQILGALEVHAGYPCIDLDAEALDPELRSILPLKTAESYRAVPLQLLGSRQQELRVVLAAPVSLEALDAIRFASGRQKLEVLVAMDGAINRAIRRLYFGEQPPAAVPEPTAPPPVSLTNEMTFDLAESAPCEAPTAPAVLLFGWPEREGAALAEALLRSGARAQVVTDEEALGCSKSDVVLAPLAPLEALVRSFVKLPATVIVCGGAAADEVEKARAIGARMYLRAPLRFHAIRNAVLKCLDPTGRSS